MDYNMTKKTLCQPAAVLDTAAEQAVDADITLPDYCPDIEKILSCTLLPQTYLANVSGDRLNVEGASCVRVMYLDGEKGRIRAYEHSVPFSASLPLRESPDSCVVYVDLKPEYMNCRALSPRKLSLHGAFSLCAKAVSKSEQEYFDHEEDDDLQILREEIGVSRLTGLCSECFSLQEEIPADNSDGISSLLSYRAGVRVTELKAAHNKIMLSAEITLDTMFLSAAEDPQVSCMTYSLPLSRVFDCEGAQEDAVIDAELSIRSSELRLSDDALDASAVLSADLKLCFNALCYVEDKTEVLTDAFSTDKEIQLRAAPFTCRGKTVRRSDTDVGKAQVELDEDIGKIRDVFCEKLNPSSVMSDGSLTVQTKMCVGILYENAGGETRFAQREAEFVYRPDPDGCGEVDRLKVNADSLSYRLIDSRRIELRAELSYQLTLCCRNTCSVVTAVGAEDDAPARAGGSALILYYADSGESVWEIGKRFCSRPADIVAENELEGDTVMSEKMLLIPTA